MCLWLFDVDLQYEKMIEFDELKQISKLKKGDMSAFEKLYTFYSKKVYNFVNHYISVVEDAEELVQEVFLAIWNNRKSLKTGEPMASYLFGISRNKINTYLRKEVYGRATFDLLYEDNSGLSFVTEETIQFNELKENLSIIIDELPPRRKEIFMLGKIEGLTYKQISEKLEISENTVDTQMRAALNYIRTKLSSL